MHKTPKGYIPAAIGLGQIVIIYLPTQHFSAITTPVEFLKCTFSRGYAKPPNLLSEQFSAERVVDGVKTQALRSAKDLLRELPGLHDASGRWLDQFRRGRFVMELETDELAGSVQHFSQSTRRVTIALILTGMLIGSAIASSLLVTLQNTQWAFLPVVAMGVFVGSALLSVVVILWMLNAERADKA